MNFPPNTFAGAGNIEATPPPGQNVLASNLDQNFSVCAPQIGAVYYPQGSPNATALGLVATQNGAADNLLGNVDWTMVTTATLTDLFNAMHSAGLFAGFLGT